MTSQSLNGKTGEMVRWLIGIALAGLVAYFTAIGSIRQSVSSVDSHAAVVDQREQSHFEEIQRTLQAMDVHQQERFNELKNYMELIVQSGADAKTGEPYRVQRERQQ